jgi:hypothetical protein
VREMVYLLESFDVQDIAGTYEFHLSFNLGYRSGFHFVKWMLTYVHRLGRVVAAAALIVSLAIRCHE